MPWSRLPAAIARQLLTSNCRLPLHQRDHATPELHELPGIDVILAHKVERAVAADAIHAQAGRERGDGIAIAHGHRQDARCDQQAPVHTDADGAQMNRARFTMLDQRRLPCGLVDCENRNVVLATVGNLLTLEVNSPGIAVGHIDELPRGMDVDGVGGLPGADIARIGKGRRDEQGIGREQVIRLQLVDIQLILALDRDEYPRAAADGNPGAVAQSRGRVPGAIDAWFVSTPLLKPKTLSAPGSSGLPSPALLPRVTRIAL